MNENEERGRRGTQSCTDGRTELALLDLRLSGYGIFYYYHYHH